MVGTKVTSKGQATIPKEIRDALGLKPGDRVLFVRKGNEVVLRPVSGTLRDLRGSVPPRQRPEHFDRVRTAVRRKRAERA